MSLTISEHKSTRYSPRTWANVEAADLTIAFALNFATAGEKVTRDAAGYRYNSCLLSCDPEYAAEMMGGWRAGRKPNAVLNIAGNGMNTLARHFWTQGQANTWVYRVLKIMHAREPIEKIVCGGQTGV